MGAVDNADFASLSQTLTRDGYFVWPKLVTGQLAQRHSNGFCRFINDFTKHNIHNSDDYSRVKDRVDIAAEGFHRRSIAAQEICFNKSLRRFSEHWFGSVPVLNGVVSGLYSRGETGEGSGNPHADSLLAAAPDPWDAQLRIWCALEDIHPDVGPMYFVPGSHRTIMDSFREQVLLERPDFRLWLAAQMIGGPASSSNQMVAEVFHYTSRKLQEAVVKRGLPAETPLLEQGDAIIFLPRVIHGTRACTNRFRTRKHIIFTLFAMNVPWYDWRVYWGALHDFRSPDLVTQFRTERTARGYRTLGNLETVRVP